MPRLLSLVAIVSALYFTLPAGLVDAQIISSGTSISVMIQLSGPPLAADSNLRVRNAATLHRYRLDASLLPARAYRGALATYQSQELGFLKSRGLNISVQRQYQLLFNGFSATVPISELSRLGSFPNVKAVIPQRIYRPLLDRSLPLIHAPGGWSQLGGVAQAGRGELIAQIDSGIDVTQPCFRDAGFSPPSFGRRADTNDNLKLTNNKVVVARAFAADPAQKVSAADSGGHGTFGAAIEACDTSTTTPLGTSTNGVAPGAYLMNYNVFPEGATGTSDSQVLSALEASLQDGADVANLSLGQSAGDPKFDFEAAEIGLATKAGMNVVVAAGNAGSTPQSIGSPATAPEAITVGASTNDRGVYSSLTISGSADVPAALSRIKANEGSHPFTDTVGPAGIVYVGLGRRPNDDPDNTTADDFAGKDLRGKIALIQRGISFFETKINNAERAGAIGAVIFDNKDAINLVNMDTKSATLPAMAISQADGKAVLAWMTSHPDSQLTMQPKISAFESIPNVLSDFSGRGYGINYGIKPDLVAPGEGIYSATETGIPNNELYNPSGYASANGTSFSAPFVTGAVTLILQKHPKWTPAMVKAALMNTASNSVSLGAHDRVQPTVMQQGSGLLNVEAALSTTAVVLPGSVSFGSVNVASGPASAQSKMSLQDVGGGSGAWHVSIDALHADGTIAVKTPASVNISQTGKTDVTVSLSVTAGAPPGDFDGFVSLTNGSTTLHVPYFVHVISKAVKPGTVLLVDDSKSRFIDSTVAAAPHLDVTRWYQQALDALGKPYTLWDESALGTPSLQTMKQSTAVIYFTGDNLTGFVKGNGDPQSLLPPLTPTDVTTLHDYMDSGGRLFVSGMGAALSDPLWQIVVTGNVARNLSIFDDASNDKAKVGGISPTQPSARPDTPPGLLKNSGIFAGLKPIDFSTKGDGAKDNLAVKNQALDDMVGVSGLAAFHEYLGAQLYAYGQPVLKSASVPAAQTGYNEKGINVGVVSSDEPSLKHRASYPGRSVFFSFGFEGINDNTGYAKRSEVLRRIFAWFGDRPVAHVIGSAYRSGQPIQLKAKLTGLSGSHPVQYVWQVGNQTLRPTAAGTPFHFSHAGRYQARVQVTDSLGHVAVSSWTAITVR